MPFDTPSEDPVDETFWTGDHGVVALEPGLSRADEVIERTLSDYGFSADGPIADRHGSFERHFLRRGSDDATHVLVVAFTPADEASVTITVTPGVVRGNQSAAGVSEAFERVRDVDAVSRAWTLGVLVGLAGTPSVWLALEERLSDASAGGGEMPRQEQDLEQRSAR